MRSGSGPSTAINGTLSNHHVVSYPRMFSLGVIVLAEAAVNEGFITTCNNILRSYYGRNNMPQLTKSILPTVVGDNITFPSDTNKNETKNMYNILYKIAWSHDNLFVGPAGVYRDDDPSQRNDGIPISAGKWRFPENMCKLFDRFSSNIPNESNISRTLNLKKYVLHDIARDFIQAVTEGHQQQQPNPKESIVSDWVAKIYDRRGNSIGSGYYPIYFPDTPGGDVNLNRDMHKDDLYHGRLSLRKNSDMTVIPKKRFRVCVRRRANNGYYDLYGYLVNEGNSHIQKDSIQIRGLFQNVPDQSS